MNDHVPLNSDKDAPPRPDVGSELGGERHSAEVRYLAYLARRFWRALRHDMCMQVVTAILVLELIFWIF